MYKVTLINGDGIGPEITQATLKVLDKAGAKIDWELQTAGADVCEKEGTPLPQRVIESIKKNGVALKAPVTTPIGKGFKSVNVQLRKALNLYANLRPCKNLPNIKTPFNDVDIVVVRENTEDLYAGVEEKIDENTCHSIKIITKEASLKIARFAFDYAQKNNRKLVHVVTKANICKLSDGLFLDCAREIAKEYPDIVFKEILVDNACMQLVQKPSQFDVMLLPNLYGDIVSDLTAGLVGGLGLATGANLGENIAVFEPVHGSAPDIAGKNLANPSALIRCSIEMLNYIGQKDAATKIENALFDVFREGKFLTADLGGCASTDLFTEELCKKIN